MRASSAKDMDSHFLWELIHLRSQLQRRSEKVYVLSNRLILKPFTVIINCETFYLQHCGFQERLPENDKANNKRIRSKHVDTVDETGRRTWNIISNRT